MAIERFGGLRDWWAGFRFNLGNQPAFAPAMVVVDETGVSGVAFSAADRLNLAAAGKDYYDQVVPYVTAVAQPAKRGIYAYVTTGGIATLTIGGVDLQMAFAVGPTVLPFAVTKYTAGTAVGSFYNIG